MTEQRSSDTSRNSPTAFDAAGFRSRFRDSYLSDTLPAGRRPRVVYAMPSVSLERALSQSVDHLTKAGMAAGVMDGAFSAYPDAKSDLGATALGAAWKVLHKLTRKNEGGYKFSATLNNYLWARHTPALAGSCVINTFQLGGKALAEQARRHDIQVVYYIDGTLEEYFSSYGEYDVMDVDPATRRSAIALERAGYQAADLVIAMSKATAQSLRADYGIPDERIAIVPPGANLRPSLTELAEANPPRPWTGEGEFNVGFVGLYPERKGLDRLAAAVEIARGRGAPIRLTTVGRSLDNLMDKPWITNHGVINKLREPNRFLEAVTGFHLGCQLSYAELTGIAVCEYLRLGIPVMGTAVGGATDLMEDGGAVMVPGDVGPDALAEILVRMVNDNNFYTRLRQEAHARREWADWTRVARDIDAAMAKLNLA